MRPPPNSTVETTARRRVTRFGYVLRRRQLTFRFRPIEPPVVRRHAATCPDPFRWTSGRRQPGGFHSTAWRITGRSSLAATRALMDWGTSGAVWLLVLSTAHRARPTAVALAAGVSGATVILTVLATRVLPQGRRRAACSNIAS